MQKLYLLCVLSPFAYAILPIDYLNFEIPIFLLYFYTGGYLDSESSELGIAWPGW